jgi:hypothetical protein
VNVQEYFEKRGQACAFQVVKETLQNSEFVSIAFNGETEFTETLEGKDIRYVNSMRILYM